MLVESQAVHSLGLEHSRWLRHEVTSAELEGRAVGGGGHWRHRVVGCEHPWNISLLDSLAVGI